MNENVSVSLGLDPNSKVENSVSLLSSLGVKVTKVYGLNVLGDVYFTKVSSLKNVPSVSSVSVVGDVLSPPIPAVVSVVPEVQVTPNSV